MAIPSSTSAESRSTGLRAACGQSATLPRIRGSRLAPQDHAPLLNPGPPSSPDGLPDPSDDPGELAELAREVLGGDDVEAIMHRLLEGDPLGLAERCESIARREGTLVYSTRLQQRVAARLAFDADLFSGHAVGAFIEQCVMRSLEELVEEQLAEEWAASPAELSDDAPLYERVSKSTGVTMNESRAVVHAVNRCAAADRRVFRAVILEGTTLEEYAMRSDTSLDVVSERAARVVRAITLALARHAADNAGENDDD